MKNNIWIEWVGLWGSGKTTCINGLLQNSIGTNSEYGSSRDLAATTKLQKICLLISTPPATLLVSVRLGLLLMPYLIKAYLNKDAIAIAEFRSLLTCYLARLEKTKNRLTRVILWEGEMHLLPILGLSKRTMKQAVNLIFKLNAGTKNCIIVMKVDETLSFERVLSDEHTRKNIRFSKNQNFTIDRVRKFSSSQKQMINFLKEKEFTVFESDGHIESIETFIRSIK
jgi:hypothetical protein